MFQSQATPPMKTTLLSFIPVVLCLLGMASPLRAEPGVTGTFTGDGKPAKLAFVSASKGEPFSGKDTVKVVLSEKDQSKSKRPEFDAVFGKLGSALVLTINTEGAIIGCEVAHSAHKKTPFSSVGKIKATDFKWADGTVQAKVSTGGDGEFFGQTWNVDLKFEAKVK